MGDPAFRVAFFGSDPIARPLLDWLSAPEGGAARIVAVFTQPDRPAGRGQVSRPNAIKAWAERKGLAVFQPERITAEVCARFAALGADLALVLAYGHILPDALIASPRLGTVNLHASLLPRYRGASPIQTAVACGERETGMTLMRPVRELDAGPVAEAERVPIGPLDTAAEVEARLAASCVPLLRRVWPKLAAGRLDFAEQDHARATFCRRLTKEDGALDFAAPAPVLAARVNGLFPWPSCAVEAAGISLRVGLADAPDVSGRAPPGMVIGSDGDGLLVGAGGGTLRLRRLQRPGGRMLPAAEFLRGHPLPAGTVLPSRPMPPLLRVAG